MMRQSEFVIRDNALCAKNVYRLVLEGDTSGMVKPGQFADIKLEGFYLRRPISVSDVEGETFTLLYKTIGNGTRALSRLREGETLDILTGLGNGFDTEKGGGRPLLIGGGIGSAPLFFLAKKLLVTSEYITVALGFNSAEDVILIDEFEALGEKVRLFIATMDGSRGHRGNAADLLREVGDYTYHYACGPMAMLRSIRGSLTSEGEFSLEERMGCGFGACRGCSLRTTGGMRRVCKDGPVFSGREIIWDD